MSSPLQPNCSAFVVEDLESRFLLSAGTSSSGHDLSIDSSAIVMKKKHANRGPLLPGLSATPTLSASTVPTNGDVNPYGVAFVPTDFARGGMLSPGDILVSNFNNKDNKQGTGTTIVSISPTGKQSLFFQGSGLGLTTALGVLSKGFVIVGNVPTTDGTPATVQRGSLLILDKNGKQVGTLQDPNLLNGPWDLTLLDEGSHAQVFVSNVLSGTVTRLNLRISHGTVTQQSATQIASGYAHRTDPNALLLGPTGLALDARHGVLYVASTADNAVFAIHDPLHTKTDAGMGTLVYKDNNHLRGPLGLVLAPNGNLLTTNGDAVNPDATQPSEIVEFTPGGQFVAQRSVDASGSGGAFGIAITGEGGHVRFAAVDDVNNTLEVWNIGHK